MAFCSTVPEVVLMDLTSAKVLKEGTLNARGSLKLWSARYIVLYSNKSLASFKKKQVDLNWPYRFTE